MGNTYTNKSIGIGILSWRAHDTLQKSLDSYPADFLGQFDQNLIYFSDISEADKNMARSYNWSFNGKTKA